MTANRRASTRELQVVLSRAKIQQPFGFGFGEFRILGEVFVARVKSKSVAAIAGLKPGDAIVAINGRHTDSMSSADLLVEMHTSLKLELGLERAASESGLGTPSPIKAPHSIEVVLTRASTELSFGFGLGTDEQTGATVVTNVAPAPAPAWGLLQPNDVILTINDNLARTISAAAIIELVLTSTSLRLGVAKRRAKQRTHPPLPPHIDDDDDDGRGSRVAGTGVQLRKPSSTDEAMPPYRPPFLVEGEADGSAAEDADLESSQLDRTVFFNEDVSHQQSPAPLAIITLKYNVKVITDVAKGGPACMANLESGDQIVVLNDSVANELSHAQAVTILVKARTLCMKVIKVRHAGTAATVPAVVESGGSTVGACLAVGGEQQPPLPVQRRRPSRPSGAGAITGRETMFENQDGWAEDALEEEAAEPVVPDVL
eukprot:gene17806-11915_t